MKKQTEVKANVEKEVMPTDTMAPEQTPVVEATIKPLEVPSKKPFPITMVVAAALLIAGSIGFIIIRNAFSKPAEKTVKEESMMDETLPPVDASIIVNLGASKTQENAVLITVKGLNAKYESIGYELQYDSEGVGKGVTSGSKPIDVVGQDMFERDIYLGTCSKNVCKPDLGVTKISVVLIFTDSNGKRSQFSKEYEL